MKIFAAMSITYKTVRWAEERIKSMFGIQNGGITLGGIVNDLEVKFGDMKEDGDLRFVGGQCRGNQRHRLSNYPPPCLSI